MQELKKKKKKSSGTHPHAKDQTGLQSDWFLPLPYPQKQETFNNTTKEEEEEEDQTKFPSCFTGVALNPNP